MSYFKTKVTNVKSSSDLQVPFVSPTEQNKQIARLWYYWHFHHYRAIFERSRFIMVTSFYNANDYNWKVIKENLRKRGIATLFVKPRFAQEAVKGTRSEQLIGALTPNTLLLHARNVNDRIAFKHEKMSAVLNLVKKHPGVDILCALIEGKMYSRDKIEEVLINKSDPPTMELISLFNATPMMQLPRICNFHVTRLIRLLEESIRMKSSEEK